MQRPLFSVTAFRQEGRTLLRRCAAISAYANALLQRQASIHPPNVFLGVTRLLHHMGRVFQDNSLPQSRPGGIQIDRKRLQVLQKKRAALGHKGNVYEEYDGPTMSM